MSKSFCLLFDEELSLEEIGDLNFEIVQDFGFESPASIDQYLAKIAGTEEETKVATALHDSLLENCSDELVSRELNPEDVVQAILSK